MGVVVVKATGLAGQAEQADHLPFDDKGREEDVVYDDVPVGEEGGPFALGEIVVVHHPPRPVGLGAQAADGHGQ